MVTVHVIDLIPSVVWNLLSTIPTSPYTCFSLHNLASCIPPSSPDHDFSTFLDPPMQSSFYFDLFALAEVEAQIKVLPNKRAYGFYFRCLDVEQYSTFYQNTF